MGTWAVSPYGNDTAADFLEGLSTLNAGARAEFVASLLDAAANDHSSTTSAALPEEVLAAAALVAMALPNGSSLPWQDDEDGVAASLPEVPSPVLALAAARAIELALPRDGWWFRSWTTESDMDAAGEMVDVLLRALKAPR